MTCRIRSRKLSCLMPNNSNVGGLSGSVITLVHEDTQRLCYAIFCGVWLNGVLEQRLGGSTVREACSQARVSSPISVPNVYRSPRRHTTTLLRKLLRGLAPTQCLSRDAHKVTPVRRWSYCSKQTSKRVYTS